MSIKLFGFLFMVVVLFPRAILMAQSVETCKIIHAIPAPARDTRDLAFDGKCLWIGASGTYYLYQIAPENGEIVKVIPTTIPKPYGLTFDGNYLWVTDNLNHEIQQVDTSDGTVLKTFPTPADPAQSYPYGLAWDGERLWHNDTKGPHIETSGDSTFCMDTLGNVIATYPAHGGYPTGLAFDGKFLWCSENEFDVIHKIDISTFAVVRTIKAPGGDYPNGLTWDGQYLWVSNNDADSIYQLDVNEQTGLPTVHMQARSFVLLQNYPNPFNPITTIVFQLSRAMEVRLQIFDLTGRRVCQLVNGPQLIGKHAVIWDGRDDAGRPMSSGVYWCQLRSKRGTETKKMLLLR